MSCGIPMAMDYDTRRKRREAVKYVLVSLTGVRDAEQRSLDNTPVNFQYSANFEAGEQAIDILDEVIDLLATAY